MFGQPLLGVATLNGWILLSVVGVTLWTNAKISFACVFHVVRCLKYRWNVIAGRMEARTKELIVEVVEEKGAWLIAFVTMPAHVNPVVEVDPHLGVHKLVKAIKGRSSPPVLRRAIPRVEVEIAVVVGELVLRGHGWWHPVVGDQTLRRD